MSAALLAGVQLEQEAVVVLFDRLRDKKLRVVSCPLIASGTSRGQVHPDVPDL